MFQDLIRIIPIPAIKADSFPDQVLCILADLIPLLAFHLIIAENDFLENFIIIIAVEGRIAAEHDIENYAC